MKGEMGWRPVAGVMEEDGVVWGPLEEVRPGSADEAELEKEGSGSLSAMAREGKVRVQVGVHPEEAGMKVYGVPVGSRAYVKEVLTEKAKEVVGMAEKAGDLLAARSRQALWQLLRLSMAQQFDYWFQLCYPSDTESIAQVVDDGLWKVMERCVGQEVSRVGEDQWGGASFSEFVVRQPVKTSQ